MLALIKGTNRYISIDECVAKYGSEPEKKGIEPVCPECGSKLFVHAPSSITVPTSFHHGRSKSCNIAKNRYYFDKGIMNVQNGQRIKDALQDEKYLKQLYSFCHKLSGNKNFSPEVFYDLLKIAKQKNIWYYQNVEPENFGFILLTLQDFVGHSEKKGITYRYTFRFYLTDNLDQLPLNDINHGKDNITKQLTTTSNLFFSDLFLVKVFANGKLMDLSYGNPYKICRNTWDEFSKEYIKITQEVNQELKAKIYLLTGK